MQSYAARQLFNSSTLLDSSTHDSSTRHGSRQNSTARLPSPRHPGAWACSQPRLASTGSTATRQLLERLDRQGLDSPSRQRPRQRRRRAAGGDSACCMPAARHTTRAVDSSTARAQNACGVPAAREMSRAMVYGNKSSSSYFIPLRTPCGCSLPLRAYDSAQPRREPKDGHNPRLTTAERHRSFARAAVAYVSLSSQLLSGGR